MKSSGRISDREALRFVVANAGRGRLAILAFLMLASSLTEGIGLLLLVPITQLVAGERSAELTDAWLQELSNLPFEVLLLAVVALVSVRAVLVFVNAEGRRSLGLELARRLRGMAHRAVVGAEWRWLAGQNSADHAAIIVGETDRVAGLANQALVILTSATTLLVLAISAAIISLPFTLLVLGLGLVAGLLISLGRARRAQDGEAYFTAYSALQRLVSNGLRHLRAARIAGAQGKLAQDFGQASARMAEVERRFFRASHRAIMLFQIAAVIILAALVYVALELFGMPLAIFLPVLAISARVVPLVSAIQEGFRGWRFNTPALASVLELVDKSRARAENEETPGERIPFEALIELREVELRYEGRDRPVLDRFDLALAKGRIVAVAGPSGSGKSSVADIVSGLIAADGGFLAIDGRTLVDGDLVNWRRQVAYVEQEPFLIDGTIAENLAWGRDCDYDAELRRALDLAAAGFVEHLPEGLQTRVGEGGRQLSVGERQRIALARALLGKPDLLILDEISAPLDSENTELLIRSLESLRERCAILLLSHDPLLLGAADEVITLSNDARAAGDMA